MSLLAEAYPRFTCVEAVPAEKTTLERLEAILRGRQLCAIFQPIIHMGGAGIVGYEGLIRGPSDSPLHSPLMLFQAARECGLALEIEYLSRCIVLESFAKLGVSGKLFLNVSPETLLMEGWRSGQTLSCIAESGLQPNQVVIELTEMPPRSNMPRCARRPGITVKWDSKSRWTI